MVLADIYSDSHPIVMTFYTCLNAIDTFYLEFKSHMIHGLLPHGVRLRLVHINFINPPDSFPILIILTHGCLFSRPIASLSPGDV